MHYTMDVSHVTCYFDFYMQCASVCFACVTGFRKHVQAAGVLELWKYVIISL